MATIFEDSNGIEWRVCADESDPDCERVEEGSVVTFQRTDRRDTVYARGRQRNDLDTEDQRRYAFEHADERAWKGSSAGEIYRFLRKGQSQSGAENLRVRLPTGDDLSLDGPDKPVGLLTDEELESFVAEARTQAGNQPT